jgi:hypothetical protein
MDGGGWAGGDMGAGGMASGRKAPSDSRLWINSLLDRRDAIPGA